MIKFKYSYTFKINGNSYKKNLFKNGKGDCGNNLQ